VSFGRWVKAKGGDGRRSLTRENRKQRVCYTVALPFTLKKVSILRRQKKKNYGNSKYFTMPK
jgi:hypothetical protein